jgi:CheY-like chemotaxis protein
VDDDEDIREALGMVVRILGYAVETAGEGQEALRLIERGLRPAIVLLDMMMPRMDGEGFIAAVRKVPGLASVPIIIISGYSAAREKAEKLNVQACLVKPIELDRLVSTVQRMAEGA